MSHSNQGNIRSTINFIWVGCSDIDVLEVAIHEWLAVGDVVVPGSLTGLEYIAKVVVNIAVASVPYLIANGNSLAYQDMVSEEVDFSATHAVS